MSIKIHDGLKATDNNPFEAANQARSVLEPLFFRKVDELVSKLENAGLDVPMSDIFDLDFSPEAITKEIYGSSAAAKDPKYRVFTMIDVLDRKATWTFSKADIAYKLVLIPNGVPGEAPLALLYSQDRDYHASLLESGLFVAHGYWDNTDPEEGVDWDLRKREWSRLLGDATPSDVGLSITHPGSFTYALYRAGLK